MRDIDLKIPLNELRCVQPDVRIKLFDRLVKEYKERYPEMKMIYACLFWGNPNAEKTKGYAYVNKISGKYITGIASVDHDEGTAGDTTNVDKNPLIVKKEIIYPAANQDIQVDYCFIWKSPYEKKYYFTCPYIRTRSSIPGFRYALRTNQLDLWFSIAMEEAPSIDFRKFDEFIEYLCKLSTDKENPKYWKKPENKLQLVKFLIDLQMRHNAVES